SASTAEAPRDKASAADRSPNGYTCSEGNAGCNRYGRCISRHDQGRTEDNRRVVLRNIDHIAAGWLNDDGLRTLLNHLNLRRGLQSTRSLCFAAHDLYRG